MLPEDVLHDVRRVGADHDQLAVRHVDDAHQAIGDRKAERGQQQDRPQRDTAEHATHHFAGGEALLDRAERSLGFRTQLGIALDVLAALSLEQREQ